MFRHNKKYQEITEQKLKSLKLFETIDGNYNSLGFNVCYTRIIGGLIRTTINNTAISETFIPLPASYFIV